MSVKKTYVFELHVTVDVSESVGYVQNLALNAINFSTKGDFHLNEKPIRVIPDEATEALAKEFIESSPTDKADLVEEKVMTHNPTIEEYDASPTPEIKPKDTLPSATTEQGEIKDDNK